MKMWGSLGVLAVILIAAFIANNHPTMVGNQSNLLSTSADLSEVAIEDLGIKIMEAQ